MKNFEGALSQYLKLPVQNAETYTMIANCYYELRKGDLAIQYYNKVLEQDPKNENAMLMIASLLINSKRGDEAKIYLNKILTINPNNIDAKNTLIALNEGEEGQMLDSAINLYENKQYNDALLTLNKLTVKNPKNAYAYYYKGVIYEEMGNNNNALLEYKNSITADPNFSLSYYMLAVQYDLKEDYKMASTYYDKFINLKAKEGVEDEYSKYAKARTKELKDYLSQK